MCDEDKMWTKYQKETAKFYDEQTYADNFLVNIVNNSGHKIIEKEFGEKIFFENVIEVGSGTGHHMSFIKHRYKNYYMTDISKSYLELSKKKNKFYQNIKYEIQDATKLNYDDNTFERLISVYNLEHLNRPHLVIKEWKRVVKNNGIISIAIPADGGVAWRLGRFLTTRNTMRKRGFDLDYIIAREHVNPAYNLISLIRFYFKNIREFWYPMILPLIDINLVYCCNIKVEKKI